MSRPHRVNCDVVVGPDQAFGVFANAFRVSEGTDGRCMLEFLVYSATEQRALVVMKIPVRPTFLPVIRDRIEDCLVSAGEGMAFSTSE